MHVNHHFLFALIFLISAGSLFAQQPPVLAADSLPVDTVNSLVVDSVQVDSPPDSLATTPAPDTLKITVAELDSLKKAWLLPYAHKLDSLKDSEQRMIKTADRRLTVDIFVDSFRHHVFHACMVNPQKVPIFLYNRLGRRSIHSFASLSRLAQKQNKDMIFAMNAGMFEPSRKAKGLFISNGKQERRLDTLRQGYGNFYMQPNGVFALDTAGQAYVVRTQDYPLLADSTKILMATQSGPMMLIGGKINPKFNDGSPNLHIRNAVGVTASNQVVFAISKKRVTFFELASFMKQYGCVNALYLDGAISQAYLPDIDVGSLEMGSRLGPIFMLMN